MGAFFFFFRWPLLCNRHILSSPITTDWLIKLGYWCPVVSQYSIKSGKWAVLTADILTCHSRKSTGVTNSITNGAVSFLVCQWNSVKSSRALALAHLSGMQPLLMTLLRPMFDKIQYLQWQRSAFILCIVCMSVQWWNKAETWKLAPYVVGHLF